MADFYFGSLCELLFTCAIFMLIVAAVSRNIR